MAIATNIQSPRIPSLTLHKASGQGYVRLNGKCVYLGPYFKPHTRQRYHQVIAEWMGGNGQLPVDKDNLTVEELCARYWVHAESYYRDRRGAATTSLNRLKMSLAPLRKLYALTLASEFGPKALRVVRQELIGQGLSRKTINDSIGEIKRLFKWGVANELVRVEIYQSLACLEGLRMGRCPEVKESEPVKPVLESHVEAVRPLVSRQVRAMIDLQLLSGARPGELVRLRAIDLDMSGAVWCANLQEHKNAFRGKSRTLYFGARAQYILREFLRDRPVHQPLFSAREAERERRADARTHRRPGQPENPRLTDRRVREYYGVAEYRHAIQRACDKARIPRWSPNQLRHSFATSVRRQFGIDCAQALLGHSDVDTTAIYAELDAAKALAVIAQIG